MISGNADSCKLLLKAGADINSTDNDNLTGWYKHGCLTFPLYINQEYDRPYIASLMIWTASSFSLIQTGITFSLSLIQTEKAT